MIKDFRAMVEGRLSGEQWATAAFNTQRIIDALLLSAQKGQPIQL